MSAVHEHDADIVVLFSALQLPAPTGHEHPHVTEAAEQMLRILGHQPEAA